MPDQMALPTLPTPDLLTVYGAAWCGDCRRATRYLDSTGIPYLYVDLERDPGAQQQVDEAGIRAIPIIVTPAGQILIDPALDELARTVGGAT